MMKMNRNLKIAPVVIACILAIASIAPAQDITESYSSVATPNMTGYSTWTFTLESTLPDTVITGFDLSFTADQMNQVNPGGNESIFTDANSFFSMVGADVLEDSQFLFSSSDVVVVEPSESSSNLSAAFALKQGTENDLVDNPIDVAQIVVPDSATFDFVGELQLRSLIDGEQVGGARDISGTVPEPATMSLLALGGVAAVIRRRRK